MNAYLDVVAKATTLSSLFARKAVIRACERAGLDPSRLAREHMPQLLPELERGIRGFLDDEGFRNARAKLRAL